MQPAFFKTTNVKLYMVAVKLALSELNALNENLTTAQHQLNEFDMLNIIITSQPKLCPDV
jgi:hypothetical protein